MTSERLLTVQQVAERLGVSKGRVRKLAHEGLLRVIPIGNAPNSPWRIAPADLDDYVAGQRTAGGDQIAQTA